MGRPRACGTHIKWHLGRARVRVRALERGGRGGAGGGRGATARTPGCSATAAAGGVVVRARRGESAARASRAARRARVFARSGAPRVRWRHEQGVGRRRRRRARARGGRGSKGGGGKRWRCGGRHGGADDLLAHQYGRRDRRGHGACACAPTRASERGTSERGRARRPCACPPLPRPPKILGNWIKIRARAVAGARAGGVASSAGGHPAAARVVPLALSLCCDAGRAPASAILRGRSAGASDRAHCRCALRAIFSTFFFGRGHCCCVCATQRNSRPFCEAWRAAVC